MGEFPGHAPQETERTRETVPFRFRTSEARIDKHGNWQDEGDWRGKFSEDTLLNDPTTGTFGALDGVGGHRGGRQASIAAAEAFREIAAGWEGLDAEKVWSLMPEAVAAVHRKVVARGEELARSEGDDDMAMMATTACLVRIARDAGGGGRAIVANVGDSRAYLIRKRSDGPATISALTKDRNEFLGYGKADPPVPEIADVPLQEGDRLLLVTDGVLKNLSAEEMRYAIAQAEANGRDPARDLVDPEVMRRVRAKFIAAGRHSTEVEHGQSREAGVLSGDDYSALIVDCLPHGEVPAPAAGAEKPTADAPGGGVGAEMDRILASFLAGSDAAPKIRGQMEAMRDPQTAEKVRAEFEPLRGQEDERLSMVLKLAERHPGKAYGMLYALGHSLSRGGERDRKLSVDVVRPILLRIRGHLKKV